MFAVLGLASCKKDEVTTTPSTNQTSSLTDTLVVAKTRIKTKFDKDHTSYYLYDANGRQIKSYYVDDNSYYSTMEYLSNNQIVEKNYHGDTLRDSRKYTLNEKGYVVYTESLDNKTIDTTYYDVNGFHKFTNNDQLTIENGNLMKRIYTPENTNNESVIETYTYYMDKLNTIGLKNEGEIYWGKDSKNLIKTEKAYGAYGDYSATYTYEFDTKGRVSKKMTKNESTGNIYTSSYTYTD